MMRTDTHCTRCTRAVGDNDLDARFKHGEIIACSACEGVIIRPTPEEIKMSLRVPLIGNSLDPEIEARELQDIFFVSMIDFLKATLEKLGCQPTPENRRKIRKAFVKATKTLIYAIVENEMKSRRNT